MENKILTSLGIYKGEVFKDMQHYTVSGEDADGNVFFLSFCCLLNYTDSVEKAFSRLVPVPAPETFETVNEDIQTELSFSNEVDLIDQGGN